MCHTLKMEYIMNEYRYFKGFQGEVGDRTRIHFGRKDGGIALDLKIDKDVTTESGRESYRVDINGKHYTTKELMGIVEALIEAEMELNT
jgi:hypothetical protein